MKILVACFSASGVTKSYGKRLSEILGADFFEITPQKPYTAEDLNWRNKKSRSSVEMSDPASRPEIVGTVNNMGDYDRVFIGFPIWWYKAPTIISTFLESYDFSGKTVVLFATSGGSGFGSTAEILKPLLPPNAKLSEGKIVNHISDRDFEKWAAEYLK
ncbi:MAG: flavodoxin [Clostridiales bacterium]|nr:flavodoxin [Clostridiales bacterium]